jgi:hypothetical protein
MLTTGMIFLSAALAWQPGSRAPAVLRNSVPLTQARVPESWVASTADAAGPRETLWQPQPSCNPAGFLRKDCGGGARRRRVAQLLLACGACCCAVLGAPRVLLAASGSASAALLPQVLKYGSIPMVAGLLNMATNKLAVLMMFYPLRFKGIGKLGWRNTEPLVATPACA